MGKDRGNVGGFAAQNSGLISDCYSVVKVQVKNRLHAGFVAENTGTIRNSYAFGKLKKMTGGFVAKEDGHSEENCYFFHNEKEGSKKIKKLADAEKAQQLKDISEDDQLKELGFDIEDIWKYEGKEIPVGFIPEKWIYILEEKPEDAVCISTVAELVNWAAKVNDGDEEARKAFVVLEEDLDLEGMEWTPIGKTRLTAFEGTFQGNGHVIKNFVLKDKKEENKGFFGFIKGNVYNLSVDCMLKGGSCVGGLAAQNDGIIGCCSAVVHIKGKATNMGGLVGVNTGEIFQSYAAGTVKMFVFPLWIFIPILLLALVGVLLFLKNREALNQFAPVPYDEDAVPNGDTSTPNPNGNFVSFQFEQKVAVNLSTGLCKLNFVNPGNSNHNIVVQLQFTDAQAKRIMGSTGRTQEEQKKLESAKGYDPDTNRTVIGESGAIRPGYKLNDLRLVKQPNGATVPKGKYNAIVYLLFYDLKTNDRAMLESQLPVQITVK